ncbi:MAG TPA: hypothetical protein VIL30_02630 [Ramlibacter sp.]|jgi:hypothetical protein
MPKPEAKPAPKRLAVTKPAAKSTAAKETNWVGIELAYTTSARTQEDIGAEFGVTKGRISQKAKEMGWTRGALAERVRAKAAEKVAAQEAHEAKVEEGTEAAVEVSAVLMANTILRERRDVSRLLRIATSLADKLEEQTKPPAARPKVGDPKPEPLAAQIDSLRKLGSTMGQLIELERTVMNIHGWTPIDPAKGVAEVMASGIDALKERMAAIDAKYPTRA